MKLTIEELNFLQALICIARNTPHCAECATMLVIIHQKIIETLLEKMLEEHTS